MSNSTPEKRYVRLKTAISTLDKYHEGFEFLWDELFAGNITPTKVNAGARLLEGAVKGYSHFDIDRKPLEGEAEPFQFDSMTAAFNTVLDRLSNIERQMKGN